MGESYRASLESNNAGLYEPIWFHAQKVYHGSHFFLVRQVMERYREKKDLHMVFIDLEKAYDKIPRNVMWWALDKHKTTKYVGLIKDMYNNVVTRVRTSDGDTDDFPIRIGLHQGSALSPYVCLSDG